MHGFTHTRGHLNQHEVLFKVKFFFGVKYVALSVFISSVAYVAA
jgi:hypothetical protein